MSSPIGRRVVVVGNTSSGKSTLGERLASLLDVPFVELDALYWKPDWQPSTDEEFLARTAAATTGDGWVVAGNYSKTMPVTWPRADTVIWLDLPLPVVLWRILVRSWRRSRSGELLWGTNTERFTKHLKLWDTEQSLLAYALTAHRRKQRRYVGAMADPQWAHLRFVRLRSAGEVEQFVRDLERALGSPRWNSG